MFDTLVVQPIFNLLVFIEAILPGHDFGLAIIIFTILVRLMMWPLVKKQLMQAKAMRELQPELKRIKKAAKGNKRQEQLMVMELYKEREISPFRSIGVLAVQFIILIGLFFGLRKVIEDPEQIVTFSYPFLQNLGWLKELAADINNFHSTLFGIVDLNRSAVGDAGIYWPAMIIVAGSAVTQYFQSVQLMPKSDDARKLRDILRDAKTGKQADPSEANAAVMRNMRFFLPAMVFIFTISYPSALGLFWFVGGLAAFIQQAIILREDTAQLEAVAEKPANTKDVSKIAEAEIVESPKKKTQPKKPKTKKSASTKAKRRKR